MEILDIISCLVVNEFFMRYDRNNNIVYNVRKISKGEYIFSYLIRFEWCLEMFF